MLFTKGHGCKYKCCVKNYNMIRPARYPTSALSIDPDIAQTDPGRHIPSQRDSGIE